MSLTARHKSWFAAIFLIPLVIYMFYFYQGSRQAGKSNQAEPIPQSYLQAGETVTIDGEGYRAGYPGYHIAYYDTLKAGNNNIMAEPGLVFAVVPVLAPAHGEGRQAGPLWTLLDETGQSYKPLSTDPGRITNLKRLEDRDILPSTEPDYLIFKVKTGIQTFYLKLVAGERTLYWQLPGSRE